MATSKIMDNRLIMRTYTTNEFTVNAGKLVDAPFPQSIAIEGYSIISYKYSTGSNVTIRNDLAIVTVTTVKARLHNTGSTNTTGTMDITVVYAPDRMIRG